MSFSENQDNETTNSLPTAPNANDSVNVLAWNMRWTWNRKVKRVFESIDEELWNRYENPVALLQSLNEAQRSSLFKQTEFLEILHKAYEDQVEYLHNRKHETWFQKRYGIAERNVLTAYFSAEFGIAKCLSIYSGGLGVLSSDHLKSASDLGIPLVGVGLFYKHGYFSQLIGSDGWQNEVYPENDPHELPVKLISKEGSSDPFIISIPLAERIICAKAWMVRIGRSELYLLDTDLPDRNSNEDCMITSELYGGDMENRIKQEIVLGFGGALLLRELGLDPYVIHMNEGHSAFVILARIAEVIEEGRTKIDFARATQIVRKRNLFTTHTPVPAGIDCFSRELIGKYLGWAAKKLGLSMDEIFALGQENVESNLFNMAVLAIRNSASVNAVSRLHGEVAGRNWHHLLYQHEGNDERGLGHLNNSSIDHVTNGVHVPSWVSDSMSDIYSDYLGPSWESETDEEDVWANASNIPDDVLWEARCRERAKLVDFTRENFPSAYRFSPDALTIGFARRVATYKRATLFLQSGQRLSQLLKDTSRPVQFVLAGKAHPKDYEGKKMIQEIVDFCNSELSDGKVAFIENYDLSIARRMVQGVDLWLNNPRRPMEASGTSGMKVISNGGLNLSVLDGWWDEAYDPACGWAIGSSDTTSQSSDASDADSLYENLENQVIPEFYDRNESGIPSGWLRKVKNSISFLTPTFSTNRMVKEYATKYYFKDVHPVTSKLNHGELGTYLLEKAIDSDL